ncbi:MAG: BREX-2 system adenine-specific DNA-methyltransferase PglX, partial [Isosphaeraceae bacterium]
SGAYIPGHGTPTVILLGRNQKPVGETVRAVLGIEGEPSTPEDASQGKVWLSILQQIDRAGSQDEFTSTADALRTTFSAHPWSIGGGGASELKELLDDTGSQVLGTLSASIGIVSVTGEDDLFVFPREQDIVRLGTHRMIPLVLGEMIRDYQVAEAVTALWPYDAEFRLASEESIPDLIHVMWPCKKAISQRRRFGTPMLTKGAKWYEWQEFYDDKMRTPLSITFAEVASHNHFVFDRGGSLFKNTAPIIKLLGEVTENDYLCLLGLLNSSVACFWMKQVSHQNQMMGGDGIRISSRAKVPYQFAASRLSELPIPECFLDGPLRDRILRLAARLDQLSREMKALTVSSAIAIGISGGDSRILSILQENDAKRSLIRSEMVFLQEEIDFTTYVMFGLVDESLLFDKFEWPIVQMNAGMRPFEIIQQRNLDDFSVPKDIPGGWPGELREVWRKRMEAIRRSKDLSLVEDDHYKRRWLGRQGLFNHTARQDELKFACEVWLLDRLETPKYRKGTKDNRELTTTAQMADVASADADFLQVAALYRGRPDFDVAALVAELVEGEAVPFLPILRYKPAGLRKREVWERTWDLQRQLDAGKDVGEIPVPPKYTNSSGKADFLKPDYWRLRGSLDVPKERWISYPHCSTDSDPTLVVGWAGWNHLDQATALVAFYDARKREGWAAERLRPLLAGLDQLIPWINQWHPEIDPEYGESAGQSFQHMLESDVHELGLTLEEIRNWEPPEKGKGRKAEGGKKKAEDERRKAKG